MVKVRSDGLRRIEPSGVETGETQIPNSHIFVFSRNPEEREFALSLGAAWAGAIDESPPEALDAVIDTTPVWAPDMEALKCLRAGGRLVINAIRKEEKDKDVLLSIGLPVTVVDGEGNQSVANVTRDDVREFLQLAAEAGIKPEFQEYELKDANQALIDMKQGKIRGAKVTPRIDPIHFTGRLHHQAAAVPENEWPREAGKTRGFQFTSVFDLSNAYRNGTTTPEEVAQNVLDNIQASDAGNQPLRAFIAVNREDVMRQARESTERYKAGKPLGVFDGVPVAVKDEMDMTPYPTTVGTAFFGKTPVKRRCHRRLHVCEARARCWSARRTCTRSASTCSV
jgi:hypothetical protein